METEKIIEQYLQHVPVAVLDRAKGIKVLLMKPNINSVEPLETLALGTGGLVSDTFTPSAIISSIQNICA